MFAFFAGFMIYRCLSDNVSPFVSDYNGKKYGIRKTGNKNARQTAANYLAVLNEKVDILVNFMHEKQLPDPATANRLYTRYLTIRFKETSSNEKEAAYTLNKSSEIRICIRDHKNNFEDINTSMFVILHELAHVMSISYNHTEEFRDNFTYITHLASDLGLYIPEDFVNNPKTYCGVVIKTTPCENNSCNFV